MFKIPEATGDVAVLERATLGDLLFALHSDMHAMLNMQCISLLLFALRFAIMQDYYWRRNINIPISDRGRVENASRCPRSALEVLAESPYSQLATPPRIESAEVSSRSAGLFSALSFTGRSHSAMA